MVCFVTDCNWLLFAGVSMSRTVAASVEDVTVTSVIFKEYSVIFEESGEKQSCFVRTWEDNSLLDICANVEVLGQRVPASESSRAVCSVESSRMSLSIRSGPQAFL